MFAFFSAAVIVFKRKMLKYDIYHYLSCVYDEIISVIAGDVISFRQKRFYVVIILTANCNNKVKITVTTWLQNDTALLPFTSANRGMHICFLQYINKILPGEKYMNELVLDAEILPQYWCPIFKMHYLCFPSYQVP